MSLGSRQTLEGIPVRAHQTKCVVFFCLAIIEPVSEPQVK